MTASCALSAAESEPNNSRAQANPLTLNAAGQVATTGKVNPLSDQDYFSIVTPPFSGQMALTMVMTPTASDEALDARIQLRDDDGDVLTQVNSDGDNAPEVLVFTQAKGNTTYFVVCRSAGAVSSGSGDYSLQIGLDDPNNQISEAITLGPMNQTLSTSEQIDSPTDVDMFSISVQAGQRVTFDIDKSSAGFDSYIRLFDSSGTQLAANDAALGPAETNSPDSYLEYSFPISGTFYLGVSGNGNSNYDAISGAEDVNGSTGSYKLVVSPGLAGTIRRSGGTTDYPLDLVRLGTAPPAINPGQRTWVIIHGWNSSRAHDNIFALASSLSQAQPGDQVLTLDWSAAADTGIDPFSAEDSILPVAQWAASTLTNRGFNGTNLNLVGHSFGSYVAGEIAERIPGGVDTITALDAAENVPGGYNPENPGEIDFERDSHFSWAFHSDGFAGSNVTPPTADEAFRVDNSNHGNVVFLLAWLLMHPSDIVGQYFLLSYLLLAQAGPWVPDQHVSQLGIEDPVGGYEAVINAGPGGTTAQSISFVTNTPILSITSHANGAIVTSNPILLSGTATDAGRGGSGISSVLVNGVRANNDTATGTSVANWNRIVSLNVGTNLISIVARDNSASQASASNLVTIVYAAPAPTISLHYSNGSVTLSWHVDYSAFGLQQNDNPASSNDWMTVLTPPTVVGSSNVVSLSVSESKQFFRLRKP